MIVSSTDIPQQYREFKNELDAAIASVLQDGIFIGGKTVKAFEDELAAYLHICHVIGCANGTDALQLALMALDLPKGSKIIVPAFTYIAPVEMIRFLGYEPVYCDVDSNTFNCTDETIAAVYTHEVKAILPVHLFGQYCDMQSISDFAQQHNCVVIEDNAQSIAAEKDLSGNTHIITTSFFPTKNLGCYGDGGAVLTNNETIAKKIRVLANHGQSEKKYMHEIVGINSRLDALQSAILSVKLNHLDDLISRRKKAAAFYDSALSGIAAIQLPQKTKNHTYYLYALQVEELHRDALQKYLQEKNIPAVNYYPVPAYVQKGYYNSSIHLPVTEKLCRTVLSLPMHTDLDNTTLSYICDSIHEYFKK